MQVFDKTQNDQTGTQILHPGSRALFRYWESVRAERTCPMRNDIDLRKITDILPDLVIIEQNSIQNSWHYRLAGTRVRELFHKEVTGKDALSGWDQFERDVVGKCFDIAVSRHQPCLVRMRFISEFGAVLAAEMIGLPIRASDGGPVQIFGGIFSFVDHKKNAQENLLRRELVSARMIWTEHQQGDILLEQAGRTTNPPLRIIQGGIR